MRSDQHMYKIFNTALKMANIKSPLNIKMIDKADFINLYNQHIKTYIADDIAGTCSLDKLRSGKYGGYSADGSTSMPKGIYIFRDVMNGSASALNIMRLVLHEVGHAYGLDHHTDGIMSYEPMLDYATSFEELIADFRSVVHMYGTEPIKYFDKDKETFKWPAKKKQKDVNQIGG